VAEELPMERPVTLEHPEILVLVAAVAEVQV
jgi:hypothetical protein